MQVVPFALEEVVRLDADHEVKITGRPAPHPWTSLPRQAHLRSLLHASRDLRLYASGLPAPVFHLEHAGCPAVGLLQADLYRLLEILAPARSAGRPGASPGPHAR